MYLCKTKRKVHERMVKWVELSVTNRGLRASNDDFVADYKWRGKKHGRVTLLIACDGIGSRPESAACAAAVGKAALDAALKFLRRRRSSLALNTQDAARLADRLQSLDVRNVPPASGTTLVLLLFDHKRSKDGYTIITLWAGDSRAYLIDSKGLFRQLTSDHQTDERRITRLIDGTGKARGGRVETDICKVALAPRAVCLTTDGVHEGRRSHELHQFLLYCLERRPRTEAQLSQFLTGFLDRNIKDNYSMSLMYRVP